MASLQEQLMQTYHFAQEIYDKVEKLGSRWEETASHFCMMSTFIYYVDVIC